jgi:hypothetical protein
MKALNDNKWFDKVRVNSWEIEILIVACILAFLFNVPDFVTERLASLDVSDHFNYRSETDHTGIWDLVGSIKFFIFYAISFCMSIAKATFSLYIFFRGFWVAAIGLSSVFPKGINIEKLKFSSYFNDMLSEYHFDKFILRLDNICSSIFSLGFLIGFLYISVFFFLSFACLLVTSIWYFSPSLSVDFFGYTLLVFLALGLIFFIDLLLLGILKKVKWRVFSYPYSKLYKFFRIITLFFIYESLYYLLISNTKKRVFVLIGLISILCAIVFAQDSLNADGYIHLSRLPQSESVMSKNYYEDRMKDSKINFSSKIIPFINSEIISKSYLKLYIPFQPIMHASIDSACANINSEYDRKSISDQSDLINCINSQYVIYIDNDTIENDFILNKYFSDDIYLNTFFMPISVNKYLDGRHTITIEKLFYEEAFIINNEDSTETNLLNDDSHLVLEKARDSIIHIPFYIYR